MDWHVRFLILVLLLGYLYSRRFTFMGKWIGVFMTRPNVIHIILYLYVNNFQGVLGWSSKLLEHHGLCTDIGWCGVLNIICWCLICVM